MSGHMRILILIHEYPPIGGGGGRVAQDVARGLSKHGHEVIVLAPYMKGLEKHSLDGGVHLVRIPSFRRKAFVGDLLAMSGYLLVGFFVGLWLIFRFRPQIIHVHFAVPAGFLAWVLSKLTGVPYVLTSHLGDVPGGAPEKTDRWFKWIFPFTPRIWRDAATVTAISDFTRTLALSHYPVDIKVIPNGIELDSIAIGNLQVNRPPQIVFSGRFVEQKNLEVIPEILSGLRDLEWHCVMIGDGAFRGKITQLVTSLNLDDRFSFSGWITPEGVNDTFRQSDILLLPSLAEGIPLTGLQALAHGLAIVASRVGGIDEIVDDGVNGFLHEPKDIAGFTKSLRMLLLDPERLRSARAASREISHRFDLSYILREYEQTLIDSIKKTHEENGYSGPNI
jgi:glycosyltransferase involved in cell wall biosynthesis